jgi:hypothetical protein
VILALIFGLLVVAGIAAWIMRKNAALNYEEPAPLDTLPLAEEEDESA